MKNELTKWLLRGILILLLYRISFNFFLSMFTVKLDSIELRLIDDGSIGDGNVRFLKYGAFAKQNSNERVSFGTFLEALADECRPVVDNVIEILQRCPFEAIFWEHPPTNFESLDSQPYEFVLIDAPGLGSFAVRADFSAFRDKFENSHDVAVSVFSNLGGDSLLLSPHPNFGGNISSSSGSSSGSDSGSSSADRSNFGHLVAFMRSASQIQAQAVLRTTAVKALGLLRASNSNPAMNFGNTDRGRLLWISTSGEGVPYLHVRLDTVPKYYVYAPYRRPDIREAN